MGRIYNNVSELIGNTPLVELKNIEEKFDLKCKLLAKLEYLNPAGSAKDRVAKEMIEQAITKKWKEFYLINEQKENDKIEKVAEGVFKL